MENVDNDVSIEGEDTSDDIRTIRRFAESSIVRGVENGIVGNTIPILEAREVLAHLRYGDKGKAEGGILMRKWFTNHEPMEEEDDREDFKRFSCPDCKLVI